MNAAQVEAADALMATGLSKSGFHKARAIIDHELILARVEAEEGVVRFDRDPGLYFYSVFGSPGGSEPWASRVEGHHLSLNYTVVDGEVVAPTPTFFGANPAEVKSGPEKGLRILPEEEDLAKDLFVALEPHQREQAIVYREAPRDIITKASVHVEIDDGAGLPASLMTGDQRQKLMSLIEVYTGRMPEELARSNLWKLEAEGVDAIHFGWAGSPQRGLPHYYRIHGPSFLVEYDNIQNAANHIHSVWRETRSDFGRDILRDHYQQHHS